MKPGHILFQFCLSVTMAFTINANAVKAQVRLLNLDSAIDIAQHNSYEFKVAANRYQSNKWNYKNFKASFLPTLALDGTIPSYSRSISRITLPNGDYTFVSQNQSYSSLDIGIRQNIAATGGVLALGSTINRIDVFGANRQTSYYAIPVSISYLQNTIGFNSFSWQKKIEPVRFESSKRELVTGMQQIGFQTVSYYFNMIASKTQQALSKQNLSNADTLYRIATDRYRLGSVSQSELLQLRMNVLNAQNQVTQDSSNYFLARQQFSRYLLLDGDKWELEMPDTVKFFPVSFEEALSKAKENSQAVMEFRIKRLEAEMDLAKAKAENNIKFSVQANFGLSNTSASFSGLYTNLESQQSVSLSFSVPLLDWGYSKTQKLRSEANLSMVKSDIAQQEMLLEQEIAFHVSRWNLTKMNLSTALESKQIAERNYELEVQRYKSGNITINDLNAAQSQKDAASNTYIQVIKTYWELYFTIRRLTLYDFKKKQKIAVAMLE